jgi:hypothetical protein
VSTATSIFGLLRSRGATVAEPPRREPPDAPDPLADMLAEWTAAMTEVEETDAAYADRLAQLPSTLRPGDDGTGTISVYPELDLTKPAFREWKIGLLGRRPSLQSVKLFNQWDTKLGRPQDGARNRQDARARIRLWIAAQRTQQSHRARLGLPELEARRAAALDRAHKLEIEILRTPATSVVGAAAKLKLWCRQTLGETPMLAEHMDPAERAIVSALGDLERLADRVA